MSLLALCAEPTDSGKSKEKLQLMAVGETLTESTLVVIISALIIFIYQYRFYIFT